MVDKEVSDFVVGRRFMVEYCQNYFELRDKHVLLEKERPILKDQAKEENKEHVETEQDGACLFRFVKLNTGCF